MATPVNINIQLSNNGNDLYNQLDNILTRFENGRQLNLRVSDKLKNNIRIEIKEVEKTPLNLKVQIDKASLKKQVKSALEEVGGTYGTGSKKASSGSKRNSSRSNTDDSENRTSRQRMASLRRAKTLTQKVDSGGIPGVTENRAYARNTQEINAYISQLERVKTLYDGLSKAGKGGDFSDSNDLTKLKQIEGALSNIDSSMASAKKNTKTLDAETAFNTEKLKVFDYRNKFGDTIKKNSPDLYQELINLQGEFVNAEKMPIKNVKELGDKFKELTGRINESGAAMKTEAQKTQEATTTLARYTMIMGAYTTLVSVFKQVVQATREMETRMAQLQIVTGESSDKIRQFGHDASMAAKQVGSSTTDIMRSTETWARLGYNLENSLNMAKVTAAFANVADTTVEQGTESMTAILKSFNLDPSQIEYVSDVLVNLGKKYAVSAEELGIAFQAAGAALEAGGNTFEESAALITAGNAAVQDASKVGNALKTTSLRIRGSKAELEDMGEEIDDFCESSSKLRNEIKALTGGKVDIMFADGQTYKSMYQIMLDIAGVWDSLSDINQAALLEDISGKRNASIIKSIITNLNDLKGSYKDAFESGGTTMKSNEIALDTIDGKMKQLSATFQGWAKNMGLEGIIKLLISGATEFLSLGNGILAYLTSILATLTTVSVLWTTIGNTGIFEGLGGNIKTIFTMPKQLLGLIGGIDKATIATTSLGTAAKAAGTNILGWITAHPYILLLAAAITAVGGAIVYATSKGERFQQQLDSYKEEKNKLDEIGSQIKANDEKISEIQAKGNLSLTDKADIENLTKQNAQLEIQRGLQQKLLDIEKQKLAVKMNAGDYKGTGKWRNPLNPGGDIYSTFESDVKMLQAVREGANSKQVKNSSILQQKNQQLQAEYVNRISAQLQEDLVTLQSYDALTDQARATILDRIGAASSALGYGESEIAEQGMRLAETVSKFGDILEALKSNKISIDDIVGDKTGKYEEFLNFLARINGMEPVVNNKTKQWKVDNSGYQVGNVDLANRPIFSNDDGSYETVHSGWMEVGTKKNPIAVHYTPIIDADTELTQRQMDEYIYSIEDYLKSKGLKLNPNNILAADRGDYEGFKGRNLILKAENYNGNEDAQNQWGENLHELQAEMYDTDAGLKNILSDFLETGDMATAAAEKVKTFTEQLSTLSDVEKNLNKIPDLLKDFKEDGFIGTEQLAQMGETFKGVSGLESYLETLANPDLSFEQLSDTLGTLTSELILAKIASGELSAENENLVEQMLKASGVANAETAAHELCAIAKEKNRLETLGLTDMTAEEISALYNEQGASNTTRIAILELIKAKIESLKTTIATAADVDQLMNLASAAGIATAQLGVFSKAKKSFAFAEKFQSLADSSDYNKNVNQEWADFYREQGNKTLSSGAASVIDQINANIKKGFSAANTLPKYTPTVGKSKSSGSSGSGKEDKPDYEDMTDAIIRRISAQAAMHEKNVQAIDDKLDLIDTEKEYAAAIELVEARERERAKQREALLQKQKGLSAQADSLRSSSKYSNTDSWFDSDGEFTEAYYNLFNSLPTKTEQSSLKDFAQSLQKYKKEYLDTDKSIHEVDKKMIEDENSIWDYRKKQADEYSNIADKYIEDQEKHGWKNGDSKTAAMFRKIQHISDETYKRLFKNEDEYWAFVEENIHKYIDALQERMDNAGNNLSRYVSKIKEAYDEQIKQKENLITEQKALYEIQQASFEAVNKVSDVYREINKELVASKIATEYLTEEERKQIFNEDDYNLIADKARSVNKEISALTSKFNDDIAKAYKDGNLYLVETMTEEYKRQLNMKERELEITQKQVDLQKKRDALNNILNEHNIRQIVEKDGKLQYEWTYDTDKARQAAEDLADVQNDIARANTEYQQQGVLNAQQGYIDMLTNKKGALQKAIDMITTASEKVSTVIDELKNPISTANKLIVDFGTIGIASLNKSMNDFLDILSGATGKYYAKLSTNTSYDKNHDYMQDINEELAKGAEANWYKIAEANTQRNAKIKGENLSDLPWQGISSKTDSMGELLLTDKDGNELQILPSANLSLKNFKGWDNPVQSGIFGNTRPTQISAVNQNTGKTVTNTIGDIIIENVTNVNDFVNQLTTRIKSFGAILD